MAIYNGDYGTTFEVTLTDGCSAIDVSAATTITFRYKKPDNSTEDKTGSLVNTGTDGKVKYVTVSGDIDAAGSWQLQVIVTDGATYSYRSSILNFEVLAPL